MSIQLLVFGADGFDPTLGDYFRQKGYLPTIDELASAGQIAPMASRLGEQEVPHTGPAWISLYTGMTEREHGVTFGGWLDGHISFETHAKNTVFTSLVDEDYRVGSAFMPMTYPATIDVNNESWMISGFPSAGDSSRTVVPESLTDKLPSDYESIQARTLLGGDDEEISPIESWREAEQRKCENVLPAVTDEYPVDVLFYGTQICDVMGHRQQPIPPYIDAVTQRVVEATNNAIGTHLSRPRFGTLAWSKAFREAYRVVDQTLSSLIDRYNPDEVLLVSDHGFRKDGRGHTFLGTSLATSGVACPEYITNVRESIERALDIERPDQKYERKEGTLSTEEQAEIESRLESLGYTE